jgi:hypothetical protein
VETELVSVLVLYVHPLLGRGLEQLLATEPRLSVRSVQLGAEGCVEEELARDPGLVIFEQGGSMGLDDLLERTSCPVVVEVSLGTGEVWTLRRARLDGKADEMVEGIVAACLAGRPAAAAS